MGLKWLEHLVYCHWKDLATETQSIESDPAERRCCQRYLEFGVEVIPQSISHIRHLLTTHVARVSVQSSLMPKLIELLLVKWNVRGVWRILVLLFSSRNHHQIQECAPYRLKEVEELLAEVTANRALDIDCLHVLEVVRGDDPRQWTRIMHFFEFKFAMTQLGTKCYVFRKLSLLLRIFWARICSWCQVMWIPFTYTYHQIHLREEEQNLCRSKFSPLLAQIKPILI